VSDYDAVDIVDLTIAIPRDLLQWHMVLAREYDRTRPSYRIQFERLCECQMEVCEIVQKAWKNAQKKTRSKKLIRHAKHPREPRLPAREGERQAACYDCGNPISPHTALIHEHCLNSIFRERRTHLRESGRTITFRTFQITVPTPDRHIFYRRLDMAVMPALHKTEQEAGEDWDVQFCLPLYDTTTAITFNVLAAKQKGLVKCSTR
jgi:hypothetical protein